MPIQHFTLKGTPSGRINRRKDMSSSVFPVGCMGCKEEVSGDEIGTARKASDTKTTDSKEELNETARKSSSENRNPVTGVGVSSNDEIHKTGSGRRKGFNNSHFFFLICVTPNTIVFRWKSSAWRWVWIHHRQPINSKKSTPWRIF